MNSNEQALWTFLTQLKSHNKLGGNKMTKLAEVRATYYVGSEAKEVYTTMMVNFDAQPNATFELFEKDWLTVKNYYLGFNLGYNEYVFDAISGILTITCNSSPKGAYKVEIQSI